MCRRKKVMVAGAVGIDRSIHPDAPVPPGGKGASHVRETAGYFVVNVGLHLRAQGIPVTGITALGKDADASRLERFLEGRGVCLCAARLRGHSTPCSYIVMEAKDRTIYRTSGSAADGWREEDFPWCLLEQKSHVWMMLGHLSSDKDGRFTKRILRTAHRSGIPVSWTPGSTQIRLGVDAFADVLPLARLVVLNREEGEDWLGLPLETTPEDVAVALACQAKGQTIIAVTNGGKTPSACVAPKHPYVYSVPPVKVQPVDTTGAGDAYHAGLVAGLIRGMSLPDSLELARQTAAEACTFWGGARPKSASSQGWKYRPATAIREVAYSPMYT